jgi:hypothetical protein
VSHMLYRSTRAVGNSKVAWANVRFSPPCALLVTRLPFRRTVTITAKARPTASTAHPRVRAQLRTQRTTQPFKSSEGHHSLRQEDGHRPPTLDLSGEEQRGGTALAKATTAALARRRQRLLCHHHRHSPLRRRHHPPRSHHRDRFQQRSCRPMISPRRRLRQAGGSTTMATMRTIVSNCPRLLLSPRFRARTLVAASRLQTDSSGQSLCRYSPPLPLRRLLQR